MGEMKGTTGAQLRQQLDLLVKTELEPKSEWREVRQQFSRLAHDLHGEAQRYTGQLKEKEVELALCRKDMVAAKDEARILRTEVESLKAKVAWLVAAKEGLEAARAEDGKKLEEAHMALDETMLRGMLAGMANVAAGIFIRRITEDDIKWMLESWMASAIKMPPIPAMREDEILTWCLHEVKQHAGMIAENETHSVFAKRFQAMAEYIARTRFGKLVEEVRKESSLQ